MKTNEAKILLHKYFEAETSIEEEKLLASYFEQEDLPEEVKPYKKWFDGLERNRTAEETGSFEDQVIQTILEQETRPGIQRPIFRYVLSGIAASLVIAAGSLIFYLSQPDFRDTFNDPSEAAAYAEKTLKFVSVEYNKGLAQLAPVHRLNNNLQSTGRSLKTVHNGLNTINKLQLVNKLKTDE